MNNCLDISPDLRQALAAGRPVVALETTIISHGLPYPQNLECALKLEKIVRAAGALPASIGVLGGRIKIGLTEQQLEHFATARNIVKISRRDLALAVNRKQAGATTAAATMVCAALAGIRVFATGGIGGVHRGASATMDISADLSELARTPVAVVCAGAKAILDIPKTLEVLETLGVPVITYGSDQLPVFYSRDSGIAADYRLDSAAAAAAVLQTQIDLGLCGLLLAVPPPAEAALPFATVAEWLEQALAEADAKGIAGKAVTPFLLARLGELSGGRSLQANLALVENNTRVAAEVAVELFNLRR